MGERILFWTSGLHIRWKQESDSFSLVNIVQEFPVRVVGPGEV
jgi:hypothetical protein